MDNKVFFILIGLMFLGIVVNIYFRYIVLKHYNKLRQSGFQMKLTDVFNNNQVKIHVEYAADDLKESVKRFISNIRKSVYTALVILVLILIFGSYLILNKS